MGSAAAGAAIGSVVPVFGTAIGFVAGLAIGMIGGHLYEKFLRNPIKNMLDDGTAAKSPYGGNNPYDQALYEDMKKQGIKPGEYADPYAQGGSAPAQQPSQQAQQPAYQAGQYPTGGGELTYDQAMKMLNGQ
jgi:hypothetical protein